MATASPICQYASKPCSAPRSTKDSGELHRLCEFHRAKANDAQRRWHARQQSGFPTLRRARKATAGAAGAGTSSSPRQRRHRRETARDVVQSALQTLNPGAPSARDDRLDDDVDMALLDDFFDSLDASLLLEDESMWLLNETSVDDASVWWQELQAFEPPALPL